VSEPSILHETSEWLVVDKPAGWHTTGAENSIEGWLRGQRAELADVEEAGLVHRLDNGTTGCVLVAKTSESAVRLRGEMKNGGIRKIYQALAGGEVPWGGRFVLHFTSRYKRSKKVSVSDKGEARHRGPSTWAIRERGHRITLVEVELVGPGRRHQIRSGFAHVGAPLLGDKLYGGQPWDEDRPALHAWRLEIGGVSVESSSPFAVTPETES
jgi:23S rRNA-/tRNA-specific pseudouridylate synthase